MKKEMNQNVIKNVNVITVKIIIERKIIRILIVKGRGKRKEKENELKIQKKVVIVVQTTIEKNHVNKIPTSHHQHHHQI